MGDRLGILSAVGLLLKIFPVVLLGHQMANVVFPVFCIYRVELETFDEKAK